jgi:hypothetical protein
MQGTFYGSGIPHCMHRASCHDRYLSQHLSTFQLMQCNEVISQGFLSLQSFSSNLCAYVIRPVLPEFGSSVGDLVASELNATFHLAQARTRRGRALSAPWVQTVLASRGRRASTAPLPWCGQQAAESLSVSVCPFAWLPACMFAHSLWTSCQCHMQFAHIHAPSLPNRMIHSKWMRQGRLAKPQGAVKLC